MTRRVYYDDAYLQECSAQVTEVREDGVILDQTIFFGRSCGVKPDTGTMESPEGLARVTGQRREGDEVIHQIEGVAPNVGDRVQLRIDWDRRYRMMKLHTTLHIISAVVWQDFNVLVTGSDITPEKAKIDFDVERNFTKEELQSIEDRINQVIGEGHETRSGEVTIEEALSTPGFIRTKSNILPKGLSMIRFVEIEGVDKQADGGIHVRNTHEIGGVRIVKQKNKGRGRRRIELELVRAP